MRKVETFFPSEHRDGLMRSLLQLRARCQMAATEVCYADSTTTHKSEYRGVVYQVPWRVQTRLEILVADHDVDAVVDVLATELEKKLGLDALITVSRVDDALHLSTGRRGEIAMHSPVRRDWTPEGSGLRKQ